MSTSTRPPPLSSRERAKRRTLASVRDAAWALFCERGYDGATAREIAARAGIAAGTIFAHATDKEELLVLVYQERAEAAFDRGIDVLTESAPVVDRLVGAFAGLFDEYALRPALARRFVCATLTVDGEGGENQARIETKILGRLVTLIEAARDEGALREDLDPAAYGRNLFALYRDTVLSWLAGPCSSDAAVGLAALRQSFALAHQGGKRRVKRSARVPTADGEARAPRPARRPSR
jgi:AcrR family transcriptional regulator